MLSLRSEYRVQGFRFKVKATRVEHGKKPFGPVLVDQLYGWVVIFHVALQAQRVFAEVCAGFLR